MKFQFGSRSLDLSSAQVMGILNATPDSFSDGGQFATFDNALQHAEQMLREGAAIIDIGGESTRPNAEPVSVQQELERVIPVVEAVAARLDVVISVDTSTPEVMLASAQAGAHLINDVRSLSRPGALEAAVKTQLPVCLMHMNGEPQVMQDSPQYDEPVELAVLHQLEQSVARCLSAGIARNQLLVDPGFGFGKTTEHNYQLLNRLEILHQLDLPLLTGLSRKRMIGAVTAQAQASDRLFGSLAGAVICAMKGAKIIRVHDVRATVEAIQVANATLKESYV